MTEPDLDQEIRAFRGSRRTVVMATSGADGTPLCSVAPFVEDDRGNIYVFVSRLARHTANLLSSAHLSLMFLEDEGENRNPFARRRLVLACDAGRIPREDPDWEGIMDRFGQTHGNTVDVLRQLPDFELFRLTPRGGDYVKGFAQAFRLRGPGLSVIEPNDPRNAPS